MLTTDPLRISFPAGSILERSFVFHAYKGRSSVRFNRVFDSQVSDFNIVGSGGAGTVAINVDSNTVWSLNLATVWVQSNVPPEGLSVTRTQILAGNLDFGGSPEPLTGTITETDTFFYNDRQANVDLIYLTTDSGSITGIVYFAGQSRLLPASGKVMIVPVRLMSDGTMQVGLAGVTGQTCPIESSTNLANGVVLTNLVLTNQTGAFTDVNATNYSRQFYRAVLP